MGSVFMAVGAVGAYELAKKLAPVQAITVLTTQGPQTSGGSGTSQTVVATTSPPQGYINVGKLSDLGGTTSAYFIHPTYGNSILLSAGGVWKAFTATCTHQVCTVQYTGSEIYCPCHGGTFDPLTGSVTGGPPPRPLTQFAVLIQNGEIYVSSTAM